tara:strand:+ start:2145 stop:4988 length:2844 start_codon:yes stop_codon:yes gene_type:complete
MLLGDYFKNINKNYKNFFFSGISFESTKIKKDHIFFAIKGNVIDGNKFIPIAIKKGSKIIVTEKKVKEFKKGVLFIHSKNIRKLLAETVFKIYNKIPNNIIAVTGTNGKSSVADFYYQILRLNNKKVASIGTLGVRSEMTSFNLSNTTSDPITLGKLLTRLKNNKIENVIMEASSHGLEQNRLDGLKFNSGIFTNFSHDHLDYHKNLKNYLRAKLYLFKNLIKERGIIISDRSILEFKEIKKIAFNKKLKLYSILDDKNNFKILSHGFLGESQFLKIKYKNHTLNIKLNLIGKIQLKNVLMSIIAASNHNLNFRKILNIIPKLKPIEGRLEKIGKIKNKSKVILDYAHTPEALKVCLLNLREQFPNKKLILLFGCGGNRDQNKRSKMGKIACTYSDKIYLTDDNPRYENPKKIRGEIKKGIKKTKVIEISNRTRAIAESIKDLKTGNILLVAGKGHEKSQDFGNKKIYFSDRKIILDEIRIKNKNLLKNFKINLIKEVSGKKKLPKSLKFKSAKIDSREISNNDIFFAIKGKKNDGNKFVAQSFKKKASLAIVNKIQNKLKINRQIKVKNTLKFLTDTSKIFRENIDTKIIGITGSCGKTSLKELLGDVLGKISKVSISPKSYNNKYGVPLSLLNLKERNKYGILEVGMDQKGEIDYLSKIIKPDIGVITNINYAHAKNFKNLKQIALAKSEIIKNIRPNGFIILNADDNFFRLHTKIAIKNNVKVISFGINSMRSNVKLIYIKKIGKKYLAKIKLGNKKKFFVLSNNFKNNIYNIICSIAVLSVNEDIFKLSINTFSNFKTPGGRGDYSKIKVYNKKINLIDESYNSNPLSLKSAIENYHKIDTKKSQKILLLGDMLELGKHSKKLHQFIAPLVNKTNIDKVYVKGKMVSLIFEKFLKNKKGKVLIKKEEIIEMIRKNLKNNDYLMVKASNATGFNKIVENLKGYY